MEVCRVLRAFSERVECRVRKPDRRELFARTVLVNEREKCGPNRGRGARSAVHGPTAALVDRIAGIGSALSETSGTLRIDVEPRFYPSPRRSAKGLGPRRTHPSSAGARVGAPAIPNRLPGVIPGHRAEMGAAHGDHKGLRSRILHA